MRRLINAAYRELGDMGLNFTGVTQDEETTRRRMQGRDVFVIEGDGRLLGTVTFSVHEENDIKCGYVNLLAVDPSERRRGLGAELMVVAERRARELGLDRVRLDTATTATHLVRWYTARGYLPVEEVQWEGKAYRSVILEKRI